ncbi:hypothetical protein AB4298_03005 [Shewanella sp. 10N.261.52.F9]|uniref:hypothetical protein n=1 Tax=Shewanella TaxID=22 RepID=UPI00200F430D|nr:hypothetical protein [Shewanella marinintestina]MCL1145952.1 hypothetical protein [Shewanella marinintestina]
MRSQSISAQLIRMTTALVLTLILVNSYPPLLNAFSDNGAEVGCHQIPKQPLSAQPVVSTKTGGHH